MEINIKIEPQEIAALIQALQERQKSTMDSTYEKIMSRFYDEIHQGLGKGTEQSSRQ